MNDRQPWDDAVDTAALLFGWTNEEREAERERQADRWARADLEDEMAEAAPDLAARQANAALKEALTARQTEILRELGEIRERGILNDAWLDDADRDETAD
jgi:hypothetical protein